MSWPVETAPYLAESLVLAKMTTNWTRMDVLQNLLAKAFGHYQLQIGWPPVRIVETSPEYLVVDFQLVPLLQQNVTLPTPIVGAI